MAFLSERKCKNIRHLPEHTTSCPRDFLRVGGPFRSTPGPGLPPGRFPAHTAGAPSQAPPRRVGGGGGGRRRGGGGPAGYRGARGQTVPTSRPRCPAGKVGQALGCVQGSEEEALFTSRIEDAKLRTALGVLLPPWREKALLRNQRSCVVPCLLPCSVLHLGGAGTSPRAPPCAGKDTSCPQCGGRRCWVLR